MTFAIICFCVGGGALLVGACYLALYMIFEHKKEMLGKTMGKCVAVKRKKNVRIWGSNGIRGEYRVVALVKDWRRGTYEYAVGSKTYRVKLFAYDDPAGLPHAVPVLYLKCFPRISYAKTDIAFVTFDIDSLAAFGVAAVSIATGIACMI